MEIGYLVFPNIRVAVWAWKWHSFVSEQCSALAYLKISCACKMLSLVHAMQVINELEEERKSSGSGSEAGAIRALKSSQLQPRSSSPLLLYLHTIPPNFLTNSICPHLREARVRVRWPP